MAAGKPTKAPPAEAVKAKCDPTRRERKANLETSPPDPRAIVARLGGDLYQGGVAALVPAPGHSRKDRSLSLRMVDGGRRLLWHCFTTAKPSEVWSYLGLEPGQVRQETPAERRKREEADHHARARKLAFCGDLWRATQPAEGSPVGTYLRKARGIRGPIPAALRFHPAAPLAYPWTTFEGDKPAPTPRPAMVAIATAEDGKSAAGVHVTALQPDGSGKASLRAPRRMYGDLAGAVVQLAPLPADGVLAIAEGLETALAFRDLTGTPCWAALSTSGLRHFTPPRGLVRLIIAADSDDSGEGVEAARVCAERASRICDAVVTPAPEGQDWNDALKGEMQ